MEKEIQNIPQKEEKKKSGIFLILIIIGIILLVILILVWFFVVKKDKGNSNSLNLNVATNQEAKSTKKGPELKKCTSDKNAKTEKAPGYVTTMHIAEVNQYKSDSGKIVDTKVLSLKQYENKSANLKNDLFYHLENENGGKITGTVARIEVCDEDNMTNNLALDNSPASENSIGMTYYINGGYIPAKEGKYRVDGYISDPVTKKTYLTDRMEVEFKD